MAQCKDTLAGIMRCGLEEGHKGSHKPGRYVAPPRIDPPTKEVGCGCDMAGIGVFNDNHEIQRCDDCDLFESDDDAAAAVEHLLKLLHREYAEGGGTVADAMDRLVEMQASLRTRDGKKRRKPQAPRCPECGERGHTASTCDMEG